MFRPSQESLFRAPSAASPLLSRGPEQFSPGVDGAALDARTSRSPDAPVIGSPPSEDGLKIRVQWDRHPPWAPKSDSHLPANDVKPGSRFTARAIARFFAQVDKNGPICPHLGTRCHLWTGTVNQRGYGVTKIGGKLTQAHVVATEIAGIPVPEGMVRRHLCGVKLCVNTEHVVPGTQAENMADMARMGTSLVGHSNPASKLTDERVRAIFVRIQAGEVQTEIARDEGVSQNTISQIANGLLWTHITGVPRRIPKRDRRKTWRHLLPGALPVQAARGAA